LYCRGLCDAEEEVQSVPDVTTSCLDPDEDIDDLKQFVGAEKPSTEPFEPFDGEYVEDLEAMRAMGLPVSFGGLKPSKVDSNIVMQLYFCVLLILQPPKTSSKKKSKSSVEDVEAPEKPVYEAPNVGAWEEVLPHDSTVEAVFQEYWAEHGKSLVWNAWIEKYPQYAAQPDAITGHVVREETVESEDMLENQDGEHIVNDSEHNYAVVEGKEGTCEDEGVDVGLQDDLWAEHYTEMFWYYYNQYMNWYGTDVDNLVEGIEDLQIDEPEDGSGQGKKRKQKVAEAAQSNCTTPPAAQATEKSNGSHLQDNDDDDPPEEKSVKRKGRYVHCICELSCCIDEILPFVFSHEDDAEEIANIEDPEDKMKSTFDLMGYVIAPGSQHRFVSDHC
jgi:hypothetical protein